MKLTCFLALIVTVCSCTERQPDGEDPDRAATASITQFEGVATRLVFSRVESGPIDFYRPTGPTALRVSLEYDEREGTVRFSETCSFPVDSAEGNLTARAEPCAFPKGSGLPNDEIRSQDVIDFKYGLSSTRVALASTGVRRIVKDQYDSVYEIVEGVLDDGGELRKYPPETTGYEFENARFEAFQPTPLDDDSGCAELWQFRSSSAAGVLVEEQSGDVLLSGFGCSSDLRGIAEDPVACDYQVELPDAVPRLWLTQLELSESGFLMKGEFRGADYKYCVELEAQPVAKL